jgi:hypothetical protein
MLEGRAAQSCPGSVISVEFKPEHRCSRRERGALNTKFDGLVNCGLLRPLAIPSGLSQTICPLGPQIRLGPKRRMVYLAAEFISAFTDKVSLKPCQCGNRTPPSRGSPYPMFPTASKRAERIGQIRLQPAPSSSDRTPSPAPIS